MSGVTLELTNTSVKITTDPSLIKEISDEVLSYMIEGAHFAMASRPGWDGRIRLLKKGSFPAGLLPRVEAWLKKSKIDYAIEDKRAKPLKRFSWKLNLPEHIEPRYYQLEALEAVKVNPRGVLLMATSCLTGDAIINVNRGGNGTKMTLKKAYLSYCRKNNHPSKGWDKSIPTHIRSFLGDRIGLNRTVKFSRSGRRQVYKLTLENGFSIKATPCHEMLTPSGFIRLDRLTVNDSVICDLNNHIRIKSKKKIYKKIQGLRYHPFADKTDSKQKRGNNIRGRLYRVHLHRLIAEARDSKTGLDEFVSRCRSGDIDGLKFYDPRTLAVHHIDGNHINNCLDNLLVLSHIDHARLHGKENAANFGYGIPTPVKVKEISKLGIEMTYDVTCVDPFRNFVANGMVVHNSGKSLTSALAIHHHGVDTLFVTPNTGLKQQVLDDYRQWFGDKNVGESVLEKKPIIITNYQDLTNKDPKLFERFSLLFCDETHHQACSSYKEISDMCQNAYYRYGCSGSFVIPSGDEMELHSFLSNVIYEKGSSALIEEGFIARPEITMLFHEIKDPNKMRYQEAYNHAITDARLNNTIASIATAKMAEKKQVLILVRRKDHGELLSSIIKGSVYLSGSDDLDYREDVKKDFNNKKINCVIATAIFGEGTDIASIDVLINARYQKTEIQTVQGIGRALRKHPGKLKAEVYDFLFKGQKHLANHSLERLETYKKEPAFIIKIRKADQVKFESEVAMTF